MIQKVQIKFTKPQIAIMCLISGLVLGSTIFNDSVNAVYRYASGNNYDRYVLTSHGIKNGMYDGFYSQIGGECLAFKNKHFTCKHPPENDRVYKMYVSREAFEKMTK